MTDLFDLAASRQARDDGIAQCSANAAAAAWITRAKCTAECLIGMFGKTSADEVLGHCPRPPHVHPNATGSIFRDKRFKLVGYKTSSKVSAHARRIGVYELNRGE